MTFLQLLIIAVVQGITEFLPISSSGHLILIPNLIGVVITNFLMPPTLFRSCAIQNLIPTTFAQSKTPFEPHSYN